MPLVLITDERCVNYHSPGHPERPQRITRTLAKLREQKDLPLAWDTPADVPEEILRRAHAPEHLARVQAAAQNFDADTPAHPDIHEHALRSLGGGLRALARARAGDFPFSLLRPPGHHATGTRAMGFCYYNQAAVTTLHALATGAKRAAVFDFDVHHGNGTEAILLGKPGAAFYSIHQHPCYPGTGTQNVGDNCFNYPVAPRTPRADYRAVFTRALDALKTHRPEVVVVSAGFDAYARDPLAQETLEAEDYHWLGTQLRALNVPLVSILEGGYSNDLPDLIFAYLHGLAGK